MGCPRVPIALVILMVVSITGVVFTGSVTWAQLSTGQDSEHHVREFSHGFDDRFSIGPAIKSEDPDMLELDGVCEVWDEGMMIRPIRRPGGEPRRDPQALDPYLPDTPRPETYWSDGNWWAAIGIYGSCGRQPHWSCGLGLDLWAILRDVGATDSSMPRREALTETALPRMRSLSPSPVSVPSEQRPARAPDRLELGLTYDAESLENLLNRLLDEEPSEDATSLTAVGPAVDRGMANGTSVPSMSPMSHIRSYVRIGITISSNPLYGAF